MLLNWLQSIANKDSRLKLKMGKNLNADIEVLQAIRVAHLDGLFILDANEGYTTKEAIEVLEKLHEMGVAYVLFEQPIHRDDWEGLGHVGNVSRDKYGIFVAKIMEGNLANVINIKVAKVRCFK
ncbi:hypothetical protein AAG906_011229 [Vitis piasezkii]